MDEFNQYIDNIEDTISGLEFIVSTAASGKFEQANGMIDFVEATSTDENSIYEALGITNFLDANNVSVAMESLINRIVDAIRNLVKFIIRVITNIKFVFKGIWNLIKNTYTLIDAINRGFDQIDTERIEDIRLYLRDFSVTMINKQTFNNVITASGILLNLAEALITDIEDDLINLNKDPFKQIDPTNKKYNKALNKFIVELDNMRLFTITNDRENKQYTHFILNKTDSLEKSDFFYAHGYKEIADIKEIMTLIKRYNFKDLPKNLNDIQMRLFKAQSVLETFANKHVADQDASVEQNALKNMTHISKEITTLQKIMQSLISLSVLGNKTLKELADVFNKVKKTH